MPDQRPEQPPAALFSTSRTLTSWTRARLAVIVGHWKKLEAAGGTLALAGARYRYTKTLWITGLADKLTLYETVAEALDAQAESAGPTAT